MYYSMQDVTYKLMEQHFKQHYDVLHKTSLRKLGEYWAEDALMDVYERCLRYYARIPLAVSLDKFVMSMLINRIKDYQRDNFKYEELEECMWESGELSQDMRAKGILGEVLAYLDRYEERDRGIIYMHLFQGEDRNFVSRIFDVNMMYISRLVADFQRRVKEKYEIE